MSRSARLRRTAPLNIVWDGNSLAAGYLSDLSPAAALADALAAVGRDVVTRDFGVPGQSWPDMDDDARDVDANGWWPGRTNILVLWETTNSIWAGLDAAAVAAAAETYVRHRLAVHPWRIAILSALPRHDQGLDQATLDDRNAAMLAADALIAARCRGWGAQAWVDVRCPGSPFRFPAYGADMFAKDAFLWADSYVHLGPAGHRVVAGMAMRAIAALPAR